jgi:Transglutaminase-like domain
MKNTFLLLLFVTNFGFAQIKNKFEKIDNKIAKIPVDFCSSTTAIAKYIQENFTTDEEKIRAVFFWTASNISYDVEKMNYIALNPKEKITETLQTRIQNTLVFKKGVCMNYAEVFADIAIQLNIKTYLIEGYTKQYGKIATLSHAWCASQIEGKWFLFDPTWGSGYLDKNKYFKKLNNSYFKITPEISIVTHMPFDFLWQFLNYPITNQEFYDGKIQLNKKKDFFDFASELEKHATFSDTQKAQESIKRIEKNGIKNEMITEALLQQKSKLNYENLSKISDDYNVAVTLFNDFIFYRNKQFKPVVSDEDIQKMIESPKQKFLDCQDRINKIGVIDLQNVQNIKNLKQSLLQIMPQVDEQDAFVKQYLRKSKIGRKLMFNKVTFFGIPLNK